MSMTLARVLVSGSLLAAAAGAQGVLSLDGDYAFGSLRTELGCPLPPAGGVASDQGTITFTPTGGLTLTSAERENCGGLLSSGSSTEAGIYRVAKEGVVVLDFNPATPGTDTETLFLPTDGSVIVSTRQEADPEAYLNVAVRLSTGQSVASLNGTYAVAQLSLDGTPAGVAGSSDLGDIQFDGAGAFSGSFARQSVSALGATSSSTVPISGNYTVQGDGRLNLAPNVDGAIAADGSFFFAMDWNGTESGVLLGVRRGTNANSDSVVGDWGVAVLGVLPSTFPELVTNSVRGRFNATNSTTGSFDFENVEVSTTPSGTSAFTFPALLDYTIASNGDLALNDPVPVGPPLPGRVADTGEVLILRPNEPDETTIALGVRLCPAITYGTATPGPTGREPVLDLVSGFPLLGNSGFALSLTNGRPGAFAAIAIADADAPGVPFLGGTAWVNPTAVFQSTTLALNAQGTGILPLGLPATPSLAGLTFYFQGVVVESCCPGVFSFTAGMRLSLCN